MRGASGAKSGWNVGLQGGGLLEVSLQAARTNKITRNATFCSTFSRPGQLGTCFRGGSQLRQAFEA